MAYADFSTANEMDRKSKRQLREHKAQALNLTGEHFVTFAQHGMKVPRGTKRRQRRKLWAGVRELKINEQGKQYWKPTFAEWSARQGDHNG